MFPEDKLKDFYEECGKQLVRKDFAILEEYRFSCLISQVKSIKRALKSEMLKIVDAGAGHGQLSVSLASLKHKVISVDIAESRLAKFADIADELGIQQIRSALNSIPVSGQTVDLVVCSEVLEHLEDPQAILKEFARITKKKGYLLISVPYAEVLIKEICPHCLKEFYINGHIHSFNKNKLKEMLESAGYTFIRSKVISKPIASMLLRTKKISPAIAKIIDTFHPNIENKGWLIVIGKNV